MKATATGVPSDHLSDATWPLRKERLNACMRLAGFTRNAEVSSFHAENSATLQRSTREPLGRSFGRSDLLQGIDNGFVEGI